MIHIVAFPLGIRSFRSSFPWNASIIAPNISTVNSRVLMFTCYVMFVHKICNKFCRITMIRLFCWPVGRGLDPSGTFAAAAALPRDACMLPGKVHHCHKPPAEGSRPLPTTYPQVPANGKPALRSFTGQPLLSKACSRGRRLLIFTLCRIQSASQTAVPPSPGPRSGPAPTSA